MNKKYLFIVGIHGDERAPVEVVSSFEPKIHYLIANKLAFKKGKRFLKKDLNRVFPGSKEGCLEEKLAREILKRIKKKGVATIIDIHSSSCLTPPFVILTRKTKEHFRLAKMTGIKRIVFMSDKIASGRALIDHINLGISIEAGKEGELETKKTIKDSIEKILQSKKNKPVELFEVFDTLKKLREKESLVNKIEPFIRVKKGEIITRSEKRKRFATFDFYPILPRSKNYPGIFCLMAKKVIRF